VSLFRALLVVCMATLGAPSLAQAAFDQFYAGTAGNPQNPIAVSPGVSTTINLFFDTNSVDLSGFGQAGVFGWGLTLDGQFLSGSPSGGDIFLNNGVSGGDVAALSGCLTVNGTQQTCQALDAGAGATSGVTGVGIAMLSIDVLGTVVGSQLVATVADFAEGDFTTTAAAPVVLAEIVPEPNSLVLLGAGLAALAFLRGRRV